MTLVILFKVFDPEHFNADDLWNRVTRCAQYWLICRVQYIILMDRDDNSEKVYGYFWEFLPFYFIEIFVRCIHINFQVKKFYLPTHLTIQTACF